MTFDISSANFNTDTYVVLDSTVNGDLEFISDSEIYFPGFTTSLLEGDSEVKGDLYVDIPNGNMGSTWEAIGSGAVVQKSVYVNNTGRITIDTPQPEGNEEPVAYTINEDIDAISIALSEGANVVIAEGIEVSVSYDFGVGSGAKLVNNGTLDVIVGKANSGIVAGTIENNGAITTTQSTATWRKHITITESGKVVNQETATWNVACYVANSGLIVNHGSFVQTYSDNDYCIKLGTIYTTMPLQLNGNPKTYNYTYTGSENPNSSLYYAVSVEYPTQCAAAPQIAFDDSVTYDGTTYVRVYRTGNGTSTFTLTPCEVSEDIFELKDVTYGSSATVINGTTENGVTTYTASTDNMFEPITITLHYEVSEGLTEDKIPSITLDSSEATLSDLTVGDSYTEQNPLYDLTEIGITGDLTDVAGKVLYSVKEGTLPDGIALKDGKLSGTLTAATQETQNVVFTVQGLNLATADFTLTFGRVARAVPDWSVPTGLTAEVGMQVGDVDLPTSLYGTYSWESDTQALNVIGEHGTNLIFTPNNSYSVDNYDWATAAGNNYWFSEEEYIVCPVIIKVSAGELSEEVAAPENLTAVYGQTFADVSLPSDEDGYYKWDENYHKLTDKVGDVGNQVCYVTYVPADENYKPKTGIEAELTVTAAMPVYKETLKSAEVICGGVLGDTVLPDVDGGKYQWVTATYVEPVDGASYQVIYIPEDATNYDWTQISGWNKIRKGVVFSVKVTIGHAWSEGVVTKPATQTATGVKTYTCGLCGATRTETIAKLPGTSGGQANAGGASGSTVQPSPKSKVGYTMSDKKSKAVYKVSSTDFEVTYVKPDKKTNKKITIPDTITYEGVTYKVTAIADNAFKNNKKLKTVKIGANIKSIGKSAFQSCTALKSLTVPASVENIGSKAFYGCKKLTKLTIKTDKLTTSNVGKNAFKKMGSSNYKKVKVKVPKKVLKAYKKTLVKRGLSKKAKIKK